MHKAFAFLGLNHVPFAMPKHPLPQKKISSDNWLKKKDIRSLREEKAFKKSHFCIGFCCWIRLSSQSTTLCVYSFNLYYVNEPVKCLKRCSQLSSRTRLHCLNTFWLIKGDLNFTQTYSFFFKKKVPFSIVNNIVKLFCWSSHKDFILDWLTCYIGLTFFLSCKKCGLVFGSVIFPLPFIIFFWYNPFLCFLLGFVSDKKIERWL